MATEPIPFTEAPKVSRAQALAEHIEREIVDQSLQAGDRLGTKEDIRLRFRVAVATVNEALRILETKGLVDARPGPGGGVFVAVPSAQVKLNHLVLDFRAGSAPFGDCLAVRNALEPLVCREAARYCRARDARALRSIVGRMEAGADDASKFLKLNWELHRRMASLSKNQPLTTLYLTLLDFVESELSGVHGDQEFDAKATLDVHRELVEAVIAGPGDRLERAIEQHTPPAFDIKPS